MKMKKILSYLTALGIFVSVQASEEVSEIIKHYGDTGSSILENSKRVGRSINTREDVEKVINEINVFDDYYKGKRENIPTYVVEQYFSTMAKIIDVYIKLDDSITWKDAPKLLKKMISAGYTNSFKPNYVEYVNTLSTILKDKKINELLTKNSSLIELNIEQDKEITRLKVGNYIATLKLNPSDSKLVIEEILDRIFKRSSEVPKVNFKNHNNNYDLNFLYYLWF
jgi:hypothetical protein